MTYKQKVDYTNLVKDYKIFVDTTSLLHLGSYEIFIEQLKGILLANRTKIIVPFIVWQDIKKMIGSGPIDPRITKNYNQIWNLLLVQLLLSIK